MSQGFLMRKIPLYPNLLGIRSSLSNLAPSQKINVILLDTKKRPLPRALRYHHQQMITFVIVEASRKRLDSGSPDRSERKRSRRSPAPSSSRGRVSPAAGRGSKRRNDSTGSEEKKARDDKSPNKEKGTVLPM